MPFPPGTIPPYAEEIAESRLGYRSGMMGDSPGPRIFRVFTASATDNPIKTIETISKKLGGHRRGEEYTFGSETGTNALAQWGGRNFVLYEWMIVDHSLGPNIWILQADYAPLYIAALPKAAWTFRISSSLQMQPSYTEIPWEDDLGKKMQRGIGAPRYIKRPDEVLDFIVVDDGQVFTKPNDARMFTATNINSDVPIAKLQLAGGTSSNDNPRDPKRPRYQVGADIPTGSVTLTITKRISRWNFNAVSQAMSYFTDDSAVVNAGEFSVLTTTGGPAGTRIVFAPAPSSGFDEDENPIPSPYLGQMLFSGIQCDPVPNDDASLSEPAFQVTMEFQYRKRGWQHTILHTYKFDDGAEAPIYWADGAEAGKPINETFHVVNPVDLTAMVNAF